VSGSSPAPDRRWLRFITWLLVLLTYCAVLLWFQWAVPIPTAAAGVLLVVVSITAVIPFLGTTIVTVRRRLDARALLMLLLTIPALQIWFATMYTILGLQQDGEVVRDTGTALYFSVVTWTTLGYGDLAPTPAARCVAAIEALLGYITMGVLIAAITTRGLRIAGGTNGGTNSASGASGF